MSPDAVPAALRVVARNLAADEAFSIHDDAKARAAGYAGGLVTGVTILGYVTRALEERFGRAWLARGRVSIRFRRPVYDGQPLDIRLPERDGALAIEVYGPDGERAAEGAASLAPPTTPEARPWRRMIPTPPPERAAGRLFRYEDLKPGLDLVPLPVRLTTDLVRRWTAEIGDEQPWYAETPPPVHPAQFARIPIELLHRAMGRRPTIHVASEIDYLAEARADQEFLTYAYVLETYERKGQGYLVIDALTVDEGGREVARQRYTSIQRVRGLEGGQ
ncbi:MAG TPA: hypothetical protein VNM43_11140 [Dehalococcoidia bacterium]|nr:hypothetical protein [Dehalococcoidia bacterium]